MFLRDGQLLSDVKDRELVDCLRTAIQCGYAKHVSQILDLVEDKGAQNTVVNAEYTIDVSRQQSHVRACSDRTIFYILQDETFVPILAACEEGHVQVVRMLLEKYGAGVSLGKTNEVW